MAGQVRLQGRWNRITLDCVRGSSGWLRRVLAVFFEGFIPASA